MENKMLLPTDSQERKGIPIGTGVVDYFPLALAEVAKCSKQGNDQHNPGQSLHWDKTKSTDHADCLLRHFIDRGKTDSTGIRESARMAWRALALLQIEIEQERAEILEKQVDDWIPWTKGEQPDIHDEVVVALKLANGRKIPENKAYLLNWKNSEDTESAAHDIVAYKVVK